MCHKLGSNPTKVLWLCPDLQTTTLYHTSAQLLTTPLLRTTNAHQHTPTRTSDNTNITNATTTNTPTRTSDNTLTTPTPPTTHNVHRDPDVDSLEALTLDGVRGVIEGQLHPTNLELNVAGDFDEAELEELVLQYMGESTDVILLLIVDLLVPQCVESWRLPVQAPLASHLRHLFQPQQVACLTCSTLFHNVHQHTSTHLHCPPTPQHPNNRHAASAGPRPLRP